jgi:hypothetical protein
VLYKRLQNTPIERILTKKSGMYSNANNLTLEMRL